MRTFDIILHHLTCLDWRLDRHMPPVSGNPRPRCLDVPGDPARTFSLGRKWIQRVSKKQSKFFSSELRQISTNFDNFWHKDSKEAKIIWSALIFHLT